MKRTILFAFSALAIAVLLSFRLVPGATVVDSHLELDKTASITNPCTGNVIDITGHEVFDTHLVMNNNRANMTGHYDGHYDGVDKNGNTYIGHASLSTHQNAPLDNGAFSYKYVYEIHFVGKGSAPNFMIMETAHITVNANGQTTVNRSDYTTRCN